MKITEIHSTNKNLEITFNPIKHSYIDSRGIIYKSSTGFISQFFPQFEVEEIAERCALKRNTTKEKLLNEWKDIGDKAANKGHNCHTYLKNLFLENSDKNKEIEIPNEYKTEIHKIYESIRKRKLILIGCEKIIFSPSLKIAGTYDILFTNKEKDKYFLFDWKTSKEIDLKNKWNSYGLKPIQHLHDCNYIHYSLQLMLYDHILKNENYIDKKIPTIYKIIHIKPNQSKSYNIYNVENELKLLLFKNSLK